jgi:ring-1,2-phenylacetyl-CoA epoxidase subunit PaaC
MTTTQPAGASAIGPVPAPAATAGPAAQVASHLREPLAALLWSLADDEFVIGFSDSEWTGIAPLLEEDVAMSSLSQDELGHARAFYGLLGDLLGVDPDHLAYDRPPEAFRHCRLLDHSRGDWAFTIARRYLYETGDAVRLEALSRSAHAPLAELVAKVRREERYHLMHVDAWLRRLASTGGEPRDRLVRALEILEPDAPTIFAPLPGEAALVEAGVLPTPMAALRDRWAEAIEAVLLNMDLPISLGAADLAGSREKHSDAFRWLWGEFTMVRRIDREAAW